MSINALNHVVERLLNEPLFLERFRRHADGMLARHRLSAEEREAIKSGDAYRLVALGMSPALIEGRPGDRATAVSFVLRRGALLPAATLAALLLALAPGAVARADIVIDPGKPGAEPRATARFRLARIRASRVRVSGRRAARARVRAHRATPGQLRARARLAPAGRRTGLVRAGARLSPPPIVD